MAINFPSRSEGPYELPDGTKVWIRTLNDIHKQRADDAGMLAARIAAAPFKKGGIAYPHIYNEYKSKTIDEQASFVAETLLSIGRFDNRAEELFPDPVKPDRTKEDDEKSFSEKLDKYEKELDKLVEKRDAECKKLFESAVQEVKSKPTALRISMCIDNVSLNHFWKAYNTTYNLYNIYFSTRDIEDHDEFYFGDDIQRAIKKIEDLDDNVLHGLIVKYNEIDSVKAKEIPT